MELKEGMYVRNELYGIGKVKSICTCEQCKGRGFYEPYIEFAKDFDYVTTYNYMQRYGGKASYNIIDLIEVGDILILDLWQHENSKQVVYEADDIKVIYMYDMNIPITNDEIVIKSILTKEMFESMSYKVGE